MHKNHQEQSDRLGKIFFGIGVAIVVLFCCFVAGFGYYVEEILPNLHA